MNFMEIGGNGKVPLTRNFLIVEMKSLFYSEAHKKLKKTKTLQQQLVKTIRQFRATLKVNS